MMAGNAVQTTAMAVRKWTGNHADPPAAIKSLFIRKITTSKATALVTSTSI